MLVLCQTRPKDWDFAINPIPHMSKPTKSASITVRCSMDLKQQVDALAAQWNLDTSDIVRMAVEDYVAQRFGTTNPLRTYPPSFPSPLANNEPTSPEAMAAAAAEIVVRNEVGKASRKRKPSS